jgi:hypothetical protein
MPWTRATRPAFTHRRLPAKQHRSAHPRRCGLSKRGDDSGEQIVQGDGAVFDGVVRYWPGGDLPGDKLVPLATSVMSKL